MEHNNYNQYDPYMQQESKQFDPASLFPDEKVNEQDHEMQQFQQDQDEQLQPAFLTKNVEVSKIINQSVISNQNPSN